MTISDRNVIIFFVMYWKTYTSYVNKTLYVIRQKKHHRKHQFFETSNVRRYVTHTSYFYFTNVQVHITAVMHGEQSLVK